MEIVTSISQPPIIPVTGGVFYYERCCSPGYTLLEQLEEKKPWYKKLLTETPRPMGWAAINIEREIIDFVVDGTMYKVDELPRYFLSQGLLSLEPTLAAVPLCNLQLFEEELLIHLKGNTI